MGQTNTTGANSHPQGCKYPLFAEALTHNGLSGLRVFVIARKLFAERCATRFCQNALTSPKSALPPQDILAGDNSVAPNSQDLGPIPPKRSSRDRALMPLRSDTAGSGLSECHPVNQWTHCFQAAPIRNLPATVLPVSQGCVKHITRHLDCDGAPKRAHA